MFNGTTDVDIRAAYYAIAKMITMGLGINGEMLVYYGRKMLGK